MTGLVVDGCAGPGGFDLGARALGLDPIGFEWDQAACATRAAAGLRTVRADVTQTATTPMAGRLDGLLFSPPCQAFSTAGKRKGADDLPLIWQAIDSLAHGIDRRAELTAQAADPRSLVVVEPLRWALDCRPRWMVWEQVPPVLDVWRRCEFHLRASGYQTWTGILNAADYGVPQTRRRAILIASLDRPAVRPAPTHTGIPRNETECLFGLPELPPWVSMAEALDMDGVDRPARTVAGNRALRWAYGQGDSYATGWTLHTNRDQRPDGSRQTFDLGEGRPAPAFTAKSGGQWVLRTEQLSETAAGRVPIERRGDEPAPTLVANADRWELRVGEQVNATVRSGNEPAPTLVFGHQSNEIRWRLRNNTQQNAASRGLDEPAPTMFFGDRLNDVSWVHDRPATTVQGDPRLGRPGHKDRDKGESQFEKDSVRITVEQAAVLQSFPADYPFQGSKTARFRQVGDAVPPLLAAHCIAAASGLPLGLERAA